MKNMMLIVLMTFTACKKESDVFSMSTFQESFTQETPREQMAITQESFDAWGSPPSEEPNHGILVLHVLSHDPWPGDLYAFGCPYNGWQYRSHSIDEIAWLKVPANTKGYIDLLHVRANDTTLHQYGYFVNPGDTVFGVAVW